MKLARRIASILMISLAWSSSMAAPASGVVVSAVSSGALTITGDTESDDIDVHCGPDATVLVNDAPPDTGPAMCADIRSIVVAEEAGGDYIDLDRVRATRFPGLSSITVAAGPGSDSIDISDLGLVYAIDGGGGTDVIQTRIDSDVQITNEGLTTPLGTVAFTGIEWIRIRGTRSSQTIDARAFTGRLFAYGGLGDDRLFGGSGRNYLDGEKGVDLIVGGPRGDDLDGGDGPGGDIVIGRAGPDSISGYSRGDRLRGGAGRDYLCCSWKNDRALFSGGPGSDIVTAYVDAGTIILTDSSITTHGTKVRLRSIEHAEVAPPFATIGIRIDASRFSGATMLWGTDEGDDVLIGGSGTDDLRGLDGEDELRGGFGGDVLDGGPGSDDCEGGPGVDRVTRCE